jgi:hypothetical protein
MTPTGNAASHRLPFKRRLINSWAVEKPRWDSA